MWQDFYHCQMKMCEDFEDKLNVSYSNGTIPNKKVTLYLPKTHPPEISEI